ncbi:ATP-binding protein [Undibacterium sp. Ji50W]|uniref:ATP-binding protein n=1 Tax=Undibacterium sp. Ji50W TaxID=3413041 RepID=UPI003BEFC242
MKKIFPPKRLSIKLAMSLFVVLVCGVLVGNNVWQMWKTHDMALRAGEVAAGNLAHAMSQHSGDTLKAVNATLISLVDRLEQDEVLASHAEKLALSLSRQRESLPQLKQLSVTDAKGRVQVSTAAEFTQISELESANFIYHRDHANVEWYIGKSAQVLNDGSWVFMMSRRFNHANGDFAGIVLAHINVEFFLKYFNSINLGKKGSIAMLTEDGTLVLRRPMMLTAIGKNYSSNPIFRQQISVAKSGTFAVTSRLDKVERVVGYSHLDQFPLIAVAALSRDEILEGWRSSAIVQVIGNGVLVIMLMIFGSVIVRQFSRKMEAAASLSQLSAIIDSSGDAIVGATLAGVITSWNAGAAKLFGYTASETIGLPATMLYADEQAELAENRIGSIVRGEPVSHFESTGRRKDGSQVQLSVVMSPVRDGEQQIVGASTIARDISERKQVDTIKAAFVSTVSHELRTPITSIRGALGLLESGTITELSPKALQLVRIAHNNSKRLVSLVNDILDIEKMASGYMKFEIQRVDLVALAMQAIEANASYAQSHQSYLVLEQHPKFAWAMGDPDRIMQIFANLLSNAAKYSPVNEKISIRITRVEEHYRVEVEDHGAGIPEMFRSRIFGKFAQAEEHGEKNLGGAGLGLNITKNLVEKMGGEIGFESEPGIRTVFWVTLPASERRRDDQM